MRKIKLNVDALRVESFEAEAREGARGTVGAHMASHPYLSNCAQTCDDCPSVYSCNVPFNCA